jgi:pimeloyl-ACP methyl ester carboxylesterase
MDAKASPTSHSYFSQRLRLHYLDWGNPTAPPLLLVHGNRDHCHNWDWVAQRLRDDYHIVAPDLRGHGDSQWTTGSPYSSTEYVYDIAQLVHQRGMAPLAIIAHSLGGNVALKYAGVYPENVTRMVVIEGYGFPPVPREELPSPAERVRAWIDTSRALSARVPRRYRSLEDAYERMQEANQHLSPDQARNLTIHGSNQNEDGTYSWKFDNYTHLGTPYDVPLEDTRALWRNIACPVLLVSGSESWARRGWDTDDLLRDFQDARHEIFENAGHWVHHDQLDRFVTVVRQFLAE